MSSLLRRLTTGVATHPVVTILLVVLVTAALAPFAGRGELTNESTAFSPDTEEVRASAELQERFSDAATATMQVVITSDDGEADVVSAAGVATVRAVTDVAVEVFGDTLASRGGRPAVVSYLQPAATAAQLAGIDLATATDAQVDQLQQRALAGPPPGAPQMPPAGGAPAGAAPGEGAAPDGGAADLAAFAAALTAGDDPVDAPSGLLLVQLDRSAFADEGALVEAEQAFTEALAALDGELSTLAFSFELARTPDESFQREVGTLFGIAALVIVLVLSLVLRARRGAQLGLPAAVRRSLADTGLSMLTVLLAVGTTMGTLVALGPERGGLFNQPTPPTQIVPILLLALGVDYAIHTHSRYREELASGRSPDEVVAGLGGTVGVALWLSMLTTGIGFLTNRFSPIPAIRDLGALAAIGILVVFLYSMTFLPAARLLLDRRAERRGRLVRDEVSPSESSFLANLATVGLRPALRAPAAVLGVALLLGAGGAYGLSQMDTEFTFTAFLPEDSPSLAAFTVLDRDFGGGLAEVTEVLVTGDDVLTPAVHNSYASLPERAAAVPGVVQLGGGPDVTTPVTALRDALAAAASPAQQDAAAAAAAAGLQPDGTVAADADVAAVYDAMAAAFPGVASTVDPDPADPAVRLALRTQSESVGVEVLAEGLEVALADVDATGSTTVVVSEAIITEDIIDSLSSSQVRGLVLTVLVVMVLLGIVYLARSRQPGLGVLVMLPVGLVVLWTFGAMALAGIPFDPVTAVVSSLVVGVGVDFCIHLGERYVEDLEAADGDVEVALRTALHHTGAALAGSAATTTFGFSVLVTASILPFQRLGVVTIYAMVLSLLAVVFVLPPLLVLYARATGRGAVAEAPIPVAVP